MCTIMCYSKKPDNCGDPKWPKNPYWPDDVPKNPLYHVINCPACGQDSGYTEEGLAFYVIPSAGLKCGNCGYTFMKPIRYWL